MFKKHAAFFLLFVLGPLSIVHGPVFAQISKVDPLLGIFAEQSSGKKAVGLASKSVSINQYGEKMVDCFIRVYNPQNIQEVAKHLESVGGLPRSIIENILTARIPLDAVAEISEWPEVAYIEAGKPLTPKNDVSRVTTQTDAVQAGTGLDKSYNGASVIVGIIDDTGADWGHDDFRDGSGKVRALYFWDKSKSGSGVSEIPNSGGVECTNAQMNDGTCTANAGGAGGSSHATHVAGSAVGDDATYTGSAPSADIIFVYNVETDADSDGDLGTTIVDDAKYVFAKATSLDQPAVVNLSLGTSLGAHDGTSLMETGLSNLITNVPGRAIVNAEGNETFMTTDTGAATYNGLHGSISVGSSQNNGFEFAVRNGSSLITFGRQSIIDIWLPSTASCTIGINGFSFDKATTYFTMTAVSKEGSGTATGGSVTAAVNFTDVPNAQNGKQHAVGTVTFGSSLSAAQIQNFSFDVVFAGNCTGDMWLWPDQNAIQSFTKRFAGTDQGFGYTYVAGDSFRTTTIPATAVGVIAAGSFMDRASWTDSSGVTYFQTATSGVAFDSLGATGGTLSDISLYSSLGPTVDGRTKPDVSAPGEAVVSSLALNNTVAAGRIVNTNHFKLEGTSMSAPNVSGIVALMFQRNKCLTSNDVKTLLTENTDTDSFTGTSLPNNTWGYGKVNALKTMKAVTAFSGDCGVTQTSGEQTSPEVSSTGGGGCSLIAGNRIGVIARSPLRATKQSLVDCFATSWLAMTIAILTILRRFTRQASLCNRTASKKSGVV